jgi:hypothetical protein
VPRGIVVPSENVKSVTATRIIETKKNLVEIYEGEGGSLTIPKRIQSLGLFDETIELMHLVKPGFGPAFRLDYLLHFLPKRLQVLWEGNQVVERVSKSLAI